MEENNTQTRSAHEIAKTFEAKIKETVAKKFSVNEEELTFLLDDKDGVYFSKEKADTLCCFVVGQKNGFLYLVTGKMEDDGKKLTDLKSDIIS